MLATGLLFAAQNGIVRYLGDDLPALQSAFIRFVWGVVLLAHMLPGLAKRLPAAAIGPLVLRGGFHALAVVLWFFAIVHIPLAQVTAIGYLTPVLMLVLGALWMGEAMPLRRVLAVLAALLGALIVLRPGVQSLTLGHYAQIGAAAAFCGSYLVAKRLSASVDAGAIVVMMSVIVAVLLAPFAIAQWQSVGLSQILWLGLVALLATGAHYSMTRAFRAAPLAVTQPITFLQLIWTSLLGVYVFQEPMDGFVLLGGAVIIGAISLLAWREHAEAREKAAPKSEIARAAINLP